MNKNREMMFGGKCPEPILENGGIKNINELHSYLKFNCLEYNKAIDIGRYHRLDESATDLLAIYLLFLGKEAMIEAEMSRPPAPIFMKEKDVKLT